MSQACLSQVTVSPCVSSSRPEAGAGEGRLSPVSVVGSTVRPVLHAVISEISAVSTS